MTKIDQLRKDLQQNDIDISGMQFLHQNGDDVLVLDKEHLPRVLRFLKQSGKFDFLMDICGVDYPERQKRFEVVYHLFSSKDATRLRMKTALSEGESVATALPYWRGADWFEREAFDMFGIRFDGHPNLRKLLTHHQFVGHPLRKDYEADAQQHCDTTVPMHFDNERGQAGDVLNPNYVPINIGPSHPAMHGTLRVMAELDGETIVRANCEIGYLHRCFEKMAETHPYNQVIPYTDRLNYCSAPMNNVGYCKAVERLMGVEIPPRAQAMRIILCELSRVIDHIIAVGTGGVELGALTAFLHIFTYREKVYSLFEKLCGARLTVSMTRIGGMAQDAPEGWFDDVLVFCKEMRLGVDEISRMLLGNKIFINRTQGVCPISAQDAIAWGYTGPLLRACGVNLDLRKTAPYYGYEGLDFDIPVGTNGDIYDRYQVRIEEMRQSLRIIEQVCKNMPGGDYTIRDKGIVLPEKKDVYGNIEGLMNHFMLVIKGLRPPVGEIYDATEAANGELGFYLVSDGSANPYRLKVRPPCFAIYQSFPTVVKGAMLADAIATVASMNVIAGELDR
ncbi:MAG: NADH dehydrogenase (quinone) subunit D [Pseudobdellovibrionaceae bacterium]